MVLISKVDAGAIAVGTLVTILLSATMVIAGLKAGITPGVSPLVVLCCWGCLQKAVHSPDGVRFLNLAQVAGSAGMAIVTGAIFAEPLLQVLHLHRASQALDALGVSGNLRAMPWNEAQKLMAENNLFIPPVNIGQTMLACIVGALMGFGIVGLATKKFLSDESLPAPEAQACKTLVMTATDVEAQRPRLDVSLVLSSIASFLSPLLCYLSLAKEGIVVVAKHSVTSSGASFELLLPFSPTYIGIGGLLTLSCSLVMFAGAFMRLVGDFCLASASSSPVPEENPAWPASSMRWVGGGAMTMAVIYSMVQFLNPKTRVGSNMSEIQLEMLEIGRCNRLLQSFAIALGASILAFWLFIEDGFNGFTLAMIVTVLCTALLMTVLGAILSLQIGSSASPVSGTVFIVTLVLCLVSLACGRTSIDDVPTMTILLTAACVSVCSANDTSQDYKTLQLCGVAPREGFLAQAVGLLTGAIVVPFSLYIANDAYGIGTDRLVAPQGQMFAVLVEGLLLSSSIPWGPVGVGCAIGCAAVAVDIVSARFGKQLPAMAMAVGLYLPAEMGVGILAGSLFRYAGEQVRKRRVGRPERTHESILTAAGLITGSAFMDLLLGIATLFGFDIASLSVFSSEDESGKVPLPAAIQTLVSLIGIIFLCALLYCNANLGVAEAPPPSAEKAMHEPVKAQASAEGRTSMETAV